MCRIVTFCPFLLQHTWDHLYLRNLMFILSTQEILPFLFELYSFWLYNIYAVFFMVYHTIICFFKSSLVAIDPLMHPSMDLHCLVFYSFLISFCTLTTTKGMTEDEMVGWHHWLNGHEFEQGPGVGDGQGGLVRCSAWGCKESDMTERLNWTAFLPGCSLLLIILECRYPCIFIKRQHSNVF